MQKFLDFCTEQHDVVCNQKYNKTLPYSFHLDMVVKQAEKFKYLLTEEDFLKAKCGAKGHDLLEDANITYNDIANMYISDDSFYRSINYSLEIAEIIFACTELRGKNRAERHGPEYINGLRESRLGLFVKLCDLIANVLFGLLSNSSMYGKYQKEFPHFKEQLYLAEFKGMFDYLEELLTIGNKQ